MLELYFTLVFFLNPLIVLLHFFLVSVILLELEQFLKGFIVDYLGGLSKALALIISSSSSC
jgi:hypothetical protein